MYNYYKDRTLQANEKINQAKKEQAIIENRKIEKQMKVEHRNKTREIELSTDSSDDDEAIEDFRGKSFTQKKIGLGKSILEE